VAWHKRNLIRKIRIQENCEPWKRLTITGRKMTSYATGECHSENVVKKDCTRDQQSEEPRNKEKMVKGYGNAQNATMT
jgi:hypothetical protein